MKLIKIISILTVLMTGLTVGCKEKFLEILPTASLDESQLSSKAGLEGSLIGTYSMLLGRGGFYSSIDNWFWGGALGGEAHKGSNAGDQSQVNEILSYNPQATNGTVKEKYERTYEGIARANATLKLLTEAREDVTENTKTRIEAEAKFLRGLYYFELKKIYNNTPYIDETWDAIEKVPNDKDLWPFIEDDLKFAYENLPETQAEAGRANKWAAAAYLAKAYLYQQKYSDAKPLFDKVIDEGVTASGEKYGLLDKFSDNFRGAMNNSKESVFAIQSAAGTGSINNANPDLVLNFPYNGGPAGCCGFNQPSFDFANSFRTKNGLPLLDGSYDDNANMLKTDMGIASKDPFTPDAGPVDPRLDHTVGRRGIPYLDWGPHPGLDWIRDQTYGGPYAPLKGVYSKAEQSTYVDGSSWTAGYTAINWAVMRFSDVLLMAAEVEVEMDNLEKAREYVNMVRQRASNSDDFVKDANDQPAANYNISLYTDPWTDKTMARDAVRFERKLELGMEGLRFFDLKRWGIADSVLNAYISNENKNLPSSPYNGAKFTKGKSENMPIPQDEIDLIGKDILTQNPGY